MYYLINSSLVKIEPQVMNQVNIQLLLVHILFLLDLTYILQYETICWLTIDVAHIVPFAS
jgi:hypothetical protein